MVFTYQNFVITCLCNIYLKVIDLVSDSSTMRRASEIKMPLPVEIKSSSSRQIHRSAKPVESKPLTQVDLVAKAELLSTLKRQALTSEEK